MKRQAVQNLSSVIKANSETLTLEQLAAQGKRQVRVVSSDKVLRLIQAIVDDSIDREATAIVKQDRDRIVSETKGQFDRVLRIQAEQDAVIQEQKELAEQYKGQLANTQAQLAELNARYEKEREEQAVRGGKLVADYEERVARLKRERSELNNRLEEMRQEFTDRAVKAEKALERMEGRLESSRETIENYEQEMERLGAESKEEQDRLNARQSLMLAEYQERITELEEERDNAVSSSQAAAQQLGQSKAETVEAYETLEQAKEEAEAQLRKSERVLHRMQTRQVASRKTVEAYEQEIGRLTGQLGEAAQSIRDARDELKRREAEWLASQEQAESSSVSQLRDELSEVKDLVREFAQRPAGADEETLNGLLGKLGERDSRLSEQIDGQLDRTLTEIDKSIRRATAAPIDMVVEATDVLVDRLFDHDQEMSTNLDDLNVEEKTSKSRISGNLERLKAAQQAIKSEG